MRVLFLINDYLTSPLGVGYLSSAIAQDGHSSEVVSLRDRARQKKLINDFQPDVLALSLVSGRHPFFLDVMHEIKNECPQLKVIAGGPHPTFFPDFINEEGIDAICRGEGENALSVMLSHINGNNPIPTNLPNWWVKKANGEIVENDPAPLIADLDTLPFPDRGLFDSVYPPRKRSTIFVMASRGCPYKCSYCFNHAYLELYANKGKMCRTRSVQNLILEIVELKRRYPLQIVIFQDDTFVLNRVWLREFADVYQHEVGLPFHCHVRANLMNEETVSLLHQAGCISVKMALESADDHIRNDILQRNMSLEQYTHACRLLHKHNIKFITQNIIGIPDSSLADDELTYQFNCKLRPHFTFATMLQVYPGTQIAQYAVKHDYLDEEPKEIPSTFFKDSSLRIDNHKERRRLRALFAFGVGFGLPRVLVSMLIQLPLLWLFELLDKIWKGYCIRFRIYPYKQGTKAFLSDALAFLRENYY